MTNTNAADTNITTGKATIYKRGGFGMIKVEVKQATITTGKYAQYAQAVTVRYRQPRQRRDRGYVETYQPATLVLEGWGHPEPDAAFLPAEDCGAVTIQRGRYASCDPRWQSDFDQMIAAHIEGGATVLADFRGHNSHG